MSGTTPTAAREAGGLSGAFFFVRLHRAASVRAIGPVCHWRLWARRLAEACREFGEFVSEISGDLADGRVTQTELRRIEREAGELIGVVHVLLAHAGALAEQGRPAAAGGGATPIGTGRRAA